MFITTMRTDSEDDVTDTIARTHYALSRSSRTP